MAILLLALLPVPPKLTGDSGRADEAQRKTNADALRAVFDIVFAPLQEVVQEGTVMDCADGKTRLCVPILWVWIADHAEHAALHGIGSKSCPKCKFPSKELGGNPRKIYEARDYTLYWEEPREQESHEPSPLHLRRLKSQHQGNHCGIPPPPPLLPLDGCCLGDRCYIPSSPSGVYPLLHVVLVPVHRWLPLMKFSSPLYPALPLHLA